MDALSVKDVVSGYPDKPVIKGLSFSASEGEFIGIIGPNGAGKSTLMKTLGRIIRPGSGRITLGATDISSMTQKDFARSVAFVSSDPSIVFPFSGLEVVMMGRFPYMKMFGPESKADIEAAERAVSVTDCADIVSRPIDRLSAGERQRIFIARAIAQEPGIMLLDEPTSHLDISHQVKVLDILKGLSEKKMTVIAVLHDLNLAAEYCDRLMLLDRGLIRCMGTPDRVLDYRTIEDVYRTIVVVRKNPVSGKPFVLLSPGMKKGGNG